MKQLLIQGLMLLILTLGMLFKVVAQSTQMNITMNDGSVQTYIMEESDHVYFEDNTYLIIDRTSAKDNVSIRLEDIRKITCEEIVGQVENQLGTVYIMPNPAHDVMTLRNLDGLQNVSIYAIDGRLIKSFEASGDQVIDISDMSIGLYLVKTQSGILKMIKL